MKKAGMLPGLLAVATWMALCHPGVQACTACFGKSDSNMAKGMNMGIFALLLVITSVLCGVAGFFVFLAKRTHRPDESQLADAVGANRTNA